LAHAIGDQVFDGDYGDAACAIHLDHLDAILPGKTIEQPTAHDFET
jgi:hypothetical protein